MERLKLSEIASLLGAPLSGADVEVVTISTDSRKLAGGELFVALTGERFDGHDFIAAARDAGAVAALVSRDGDWGLPYVKVADTRLALGDLARALRQRLPVKLVGITGSNGKTTVKEMTAAILRQVGPTLATIGNLNNDIGVPLTLFRLSRSFRYGVIEMGANHQGEIDYLARVALPDVGLVNNAGNAHLEGFGGLDGVAKGKGEMFSALPEHGVAVINADDKYAPYWRQLAGERTVIDFGIEQPAKVRAEEIQADGRFKLITPMGSSTVKLPLPGRHNVMNALAAAAVAIALDAPVSAIIAGLESVAKVKGRLNWVVSRSGARLLDDTYNANPNSLRAGLEVLAAQPDERWLVLGDMGELGPEARELHAQAGEWARAAKVSRLYAVGELSLAAVEVFGCQGRHFPSKDALIAALRDELRPGVAALVKGSRFMGMEQVVQALTAPEKEAK